MKRKYDLESIADDIKNGMSYGDFKKKYQDVMGKYYCRKVYYSYKEATEHFTPAEFEVER